MATSLGSNKIRVSKPKRRSNVQPRHKVSAGRTCLSRDVIWIEARHHYRLDEGYVWILGNYLFGMR